MLRLRAERGFVFQAKLVFIDPCSGVKKRKEEKTPEVTLQERVEDSPY